MHILLTLKDKCQKNLNKRKKTRNLWTGFWSNYQKKKKIKNQFRVCWAMSAVSCSHRLMINLATLYFIQHCGRTKTSVTNEPKIEMILTTRFQKTNIQHSCFTTCSKSGNYNQASISSTQHTSLLAKSLHNIAYPHKLV